MSVILVIVHIIVCIALIMIVLLQTGKGADMGAAFGGGSSQTLFGSTGASTFLSKATTVAAVVFMLTSLSLAYVSSHKSGGSVVMDANIPEKAPIEEPVTPVTPQPESDATPVTPKPEADASTSEEVKSEAETTATIVEPQETEPAVPVTESVPEPVESAETSHPVEIEEQAVQVESGVAIPQAEDTVQEVVETAVERSEVVTGETEETGEAVPQN